MKKLLTAILICSASGCMSGVTHVVALEPLQAETKAARVPIYISPDDGRRENHAGLGESIHFRSGQVFSEVFNGIDPLGPRLEILKLDADDRITDVGFTGMFLVRVAAVLHTKDGDHPVNAEGLMRSHGFKAPTTCAQIACERACVDLAAQCLPFLPKSPAPPP